MAKPYPKEMIDAAIEEYEKGVGTGAIAAKYKFNPTMLTHWIRKRGGAVRTISEAKRRYTLDETAFSVLTEESAYWIGFLLADGNIASHRPTLSLRLASKDAQHVSSFRDFLKTDRPLHYIGQTAVDLSVDSVRLVADLAKYGVAPRKTHTATVPQELSDNRHFFRGLLDGDGHLSWCGRTKQAIVQLVGTKDVCEAFHRFVASRLPHLAPQVRPHKSIWGVQYGGRAIAGMVAEMYASGVSLARKRQVAEDFESVYLERESGPAKGECHHSAKITAADVPVIRDRRANGDTLESIANSYSITIQAVWAICIRKTWKHVTG